MIHGTALEECKGKVFHRERWWCSIWMEGIGACPYLNPNIQLLIVTTVTFSNDYCCTCTTRSNVMVHLKNPTPYKLETIWLVSYWLWKQRYFIDDRQHSIIIVSSNEKEVDIYQGEPTIIYYITYLQFCTYLWSVFPWPSVNITSVSYKKKSLKSTLCICFDKQRSFY